MKRKILLFLTAAILACLLAACGQEEESSKGVLVRAAPFFQRLTGIKIVPLDSLKCPS